jgi:hypothetical protein
MSDVRVPPIAHRAKWAQEPTEYDTIVADAAAPSSPVAKHTRRVIVEIEIDRTHALDAILRSIENRDDARVVRVVE